MQKFYCDICGREKDNDDLAPVYITCDFYTDRENYDVGVDVCGSCREDIRLRIEGEIVALKGGN